jgi:hypothetical protein
LAGAAKSAAGAYRRGVRSCDINVNRRFRAPDGRMVVGRNWDGPVDRTVRVVRIDGLDEKPVATIVHYACHPTTMAWQTHYATRLSRYGEKGSGGAVGRGVFVPAGRDRRRRAEARVYGRLERLPRFREDARARSLEAPPMRKVATKWKRRHSLPARPSLWWNSPWSC